MSIVKVRTRYQVAALAAAFVPASSALAVDFNWNVVGPADWNVGTNWNPEGPPSGGGGNHAFINNGGTAEISADIADIQDIFVGAGAATSGTLNQSAGATFQGSGSWMFVGQDGGTGIYNLSGGTANKERLYVGRGAGGVGELNLSGTGVVGGDLFIAGVGGGTATINVTEDGSFNTTGNLEFQNAAITATDNALIKSANEVWFGNGGGQNTTLDMNSGAIEANTWIAIGRDNAAATVNLSGTASMTKFKVDDGDAGVVSNSEGSFITIGGLGGDATTGTLNVSENATVLSETGMIVSESVGRGAVVNQMGGTVTLNDYAPRESQADLGQSLVIDWSGSALQAEYNLTGGTLNAQTVWLNGGHFRQAGGVFNSTVFNQTGGTLIPGASAGTVTITGDYNMTGGDLEIELLGLTAGTEYDQVIVSGDVSLAGDLSLLVGFTPTLGDQFTILDNQGGNAVAGSFLGLGEGAVVSDSGHFFSISYVGGDGNDVVLTNVVPEPASLALLGLGGLCMLRRRRA